MQFQKQRASFGVFRPTYQQNEERDWEKMIRSYHSLLRPRNEGWFGRKLHHFICLSKQKMNSSSCQHLTVKQDCTGRKCTHTYEFTFNLKILAFPTSRCTAQNGSKRLRQWKATTRDQPDERERAKKQDTEWECERERDPEQQLARKRLHLSLAMVTIQLNICLALHCVCWWKETVIAICLWREGVVPALRARHPLVQLNWVRKPWDRDRVCRAWSIDYSALQCSVASSH